MRKLETLQSFKNLSDNNLTLQEVRLLSFHNVWKDLCTNEKRDLSLDPLNAEVIHYWQEAARQDARLFKQTGHMIFELQMIENDEAVEQIHEFIGNLDTKTIKSGLVLQDVAQRAIDIIESFDCD